MESAFAVDDWELSVDEASDGIRGGGGGRGNGESCDGIGMPGAEGTTTRAFFFNVWIFSLYASFSSLTSFSPCLGGLSVDYIAKVVSMAITSRGILFGLPVKLLPIFLDDPSWLSMGGNEAYIMNLCPSPLRHSKARYSPSKDIAQSRLSDGSHGRAKVCSLQRDHEVSSP